MNDTNDEWNDDTLVTQKPNKMPPVIQKPKPSSNPNGIKDHIEEFILGKIDHAQVHSVYMHTYSYNKINIDPTNLLKYIKPEETKDPIRTKKFIETLSVPNVDLGKPHLSR